MASNSKQQSNPFSFKSFVKKKDSVPETVKNVNIDSKAKDFDEEDIHSTKENPFSFKAFVPKKETVNTLPDPQASKHIPLLRLSDSDESEDEASEMNDLLPFKDEEISIPNTFDHFSTTSSDPLMVTTPGHDSSDDDDDSSIGSPTELAIPSFMNDPSSKPFDRSTFLTEFKKCQKENDKLTKALKDCELKLQQEKKKNVSLEKKLVMQKKKELSETKALEEMVVKVEDNLAVANKRAFVAESTIATLKSEIQKLQNELATVKNPQAVHQSYQDLIFGIKEKANYASQQLLVASQTADLKIKDLCKGIETLKLVSEILVNIDSSFEVRSTNDQ